MSAFGDPSAGVTVPSRFARACPAFGAHRRLDIAATRIKDASVSKHQSVERFLLPVGIVPEAEREMSRLSDLSFDHGNFFLEQRLEWPGDIMPCCLVHLLGQSLLLLIDKGESGDIGLKRDFQNWSVI